MSSCLSEQVHNAEPILAKLMSTQYILDEAELQSHYLALLAWLQKRLLRFHLNLKTKRIWTELKCPKRIRYRTRN